MRADSSEYPIVSGSGRHYDRDTAASGRFRDARMRHEQRRRDEAGPRRRTDYLEQVLHPFAARYDEAVEAVPVPRIVDRRGVERRHGAPITFGILDVRAACGERVAQQLAAALPAKDHDPFSGHLL